MSDQPSGVEVLPPEATRAEIDAATARLTPDAVLPPGVQPSRNYLAAVELGHVLSASGYFRDARDAAKAAVKVMIGMDIGVSPTAALQGIHTFEEDGKVIFLTEARLFAGVVKRHPSVEYKIVETTEERCEIEFLRRDDEGAWQPEGPNIVWTIDKARKAVKGFASKPVWKNQPDVMLRWRVLSEGFRLYFPDLQAGQPVYTFEEFDRDASSPGLREALAPAKPQPLTDAKAERLREQIEGAYDELKEMNPSRLAPGLYASLVAKAEHSHARLEAELARIVDLRDTERAFRAACDELAAAVDDDKVVKAVIDRAERKAGGAERVAAVQAAVAEAQGEGGGDDASSDSPQA